MTARAIVVGLAGAILIAAGGYFNDQVLQLESIIAGNLLPISVLAPLILGVILVNPVLSRLRGRWRFRPAELATVVLLMFVACSIPARGLLETFTPTLAMPAYYNRANPGWQARGLVEYVPAGMLPAGGQYDQRVTAGFIQGLAPSAGHIGLEQVPWDAWRAPLATWMPLVVLSAVSGICMGLIVHRQWSLREHLRYPIAEVCSWLVRQDAGHIGPVFRNRRFWIGLGVVLSIHLVNGTAAWFPGSVAIPMEFNFGAAWVLFPWMRGPDWGTNLLIVRLYPTVIAFSFFLASDITLSLGLTQYLYVPLAAWLIWTGVDMRSDYMAGGSVGWQRFGSYLGLALILLYVGRRYYADLLRQAVTLRPRPGVQGYEAWSCRLLGAALAAMVVLLAQSGLPWPLAALTVGLIMLTFLVVARISAETGLFMVHPRWQALGVFFGLFGYYALGPSAIIIAGTVCAVLSIDPSQSLMPYFQNALKAGAEAGLRPGRAGLGAGAAYVLCLALAVPVVLWANYNYGVTQTDFTTYRVPTMTFRAAETAIDQLAFADRLGASKDLSLWERIANIRPQAGFLWFAGAGLVLVLVVGALRLRFHWWPLHPVVFLVWQTWPMVMFCHSFLIGWLAKRVVVRFGGRRLFHHCQALMIGVIAGDILGGAVFIVVGAIYYAFTGTAPVKYEIFPM